MHRASIPAAYSPHGCLGASDRVHVYKQRAYSTTETAVEAAQCAKERAKQASPALSPCLQNSHCSHPSCGYLWPSDSACVLFPKPAAYGTTGIAKESAQRAKERAKQALSNRQPLLPIWTSVCCMQTPHFSGQAFATYVLPPMNCPASAAHIPVAVLGFSCSACQHIVIGLIVVLRQARSQRP